MKISMCENMFFTNVLELLVVIAKACITIIIDHIYIFKHETLL